MPGAATFKDCKTLESIVKKQAAEDRPYAAICAAPAVALGSWGLLKGLKVRKKILALVICVPYCHLLRRDLSAKTVLTMKF